MEHLGSPRLRGVSPLSCRQGAQGLAHVVRHTVLVMMITRKRDPFSEIGYVLFGRWRGAT